MYDGKDSPESSCFCCSGVSTALPAPVTVPQAPLEAVEDCHAATYRGTSSGDINWSGVLPPGESVTIGRKTSRLGLTE